MAVPNNPVIPVIFHVLYSETLEQVSEAQLYAQIDALNRDYGFAQNSFTHAALDEEDFSVVSNHIGVQFCLPQLGGDSTAINYYPITRTDWQFDNAMKNSTTGGITPWNPNKFLNVYVVDINDTLNVAGYAQMPGGADSTDAIVIDYRFVGNAESPYNMGRTLVHLIGNSFGVYSIWGVGDCDTNGDFVFDTPAHNAPNFGCPSYQHVSTCYQDKLVTENTMNFMDSSDDACLSMWTTGQKYRFFAFLQAARSNLIQHNYTCSSNPNLAANEITPTASVISEPSLLLSNEVKVYPNPGRDYVNIQLALAVQNQVQLQLTDLNGRLIYEQKEVASISNFRISTDDWLTGIYILSIRYEGKLIHSEKVAIQH